MISRHSSLLWISLQFVLVAAVVPRFQRWSQTRKCDADRIGERQMNAAIEISSYQRRVFHTQYSITACTRHSLSASTHACYSKNVFIPRTSYTTTIHHEAAFTDCGPFFWTSHIYWLLCRFKRSISVFSFCSHGLSCSFRLQVIVLSLIRCTGFTALCEVAGSRGTRQIQTRVWDVSKDQ